jgi:hypothetical protein
VSERSEPYGVRIAVPLVLGVAGLVMAYHPMLLTALDSIQTDPGDNRFLNYMLEHSLRWLLGTHLHRDFWSPPFFFPVRNVGAYSETLAGSAPFYWLWRALGLPPDTSFQLWMFTASFLNYALWFALLRFRLGVGTVGSSFGAFLFAFGAPRLNQMSHQQLFFQAYTVASLWALAEVFASHSASRLKRLFLWLVFWLGLAGQIWSGFYLGWFLVFALGIAGCWAMVLKGLRQRFIRIIQRDAVWILVAGLVGAACLLPLFSHSLQAMQVVGMRGFGGLFLPEWRSWLNVGPGSWLWGWTAELPVFRPQPEEQRLGLGWLTPLCCAAGLFHERVRAEARLAALVGLTLWVCVTKVPLPALVVAAFACGLLLGGRHGIRTWVLSGLAVLAAAVAAVFVTSDLVAWSMVYRLVPGAAALRAIGRAGVFLLIPASLGLAWFLERLRTQRGWAEALGVGLICLLEQGVTTPSYDKIHQRAVVGTIARQVDTRCGAFFYSPSRYEVDHWKYHLDAMWAGLESEVPTVNGYSGWIPPGWEPLYLASVATRADTNRVSLALDAWIRANGLSGQNVCWLAPLHGEGNPPRGPAVP